VIDDDRTDLIDNARSVCLCDVGQPDYIATVVVGPDGGDRLILAHRDAIGDERVRYDASCPDAAHEQIGPLPAGWRHRIRLAPIRCGLTLAGRPCRTQLGRAGAACKWHRNAPEPARGAR
jgi:hypothetical protein